MLDNTSNQRSKFTTTKLVEINDGARGKYNENSQIKFKTTMLKSSLCDYSGAYLLLSGVITIDGVGADDNEKRLVEINKGVIFKNHAPFTDYISKINHIQKDYAKDLDAMMPMYNLI